MKSALHTDDALANLSVGKAFAEHRTVAHTLGEYVTKDGLAHTQTVESFFAILKRGIIGSFHSVSSSTCSATWTSSLSAGIRAHRLASRTLSGPRSRSRVRMASG